MSISSLTDARANFTNIVEEVAATGSTWTITKHGQPVAMLISYDEYESLIETVNVLSDPDAAAAISAAELDAADGAIEEA